MPLQLIGIAILLVVAVVLFMVFRKSKERSPEEMMERMGRYATREEMLAVVDSSGRHTPSSMATSLEQMMQGRSVIERTSNALMRADLRITVGEFLVFRVLGAVAGFGIGVLGIAVLAPAFGILLGLVLALVGFQAPAIYVGIKGNMRRKKFINQLGDTITLMANSLRAGYSLLQCMELVSRETKDPISTEFSRVVREVGLGISTEEAMQNMLRRVPSEDLDLLVTAINIQHEVGGNLAQILSTIGHTIRERVRIKGEVSVLTAQVQLSGYIITAMPIALAAFIMLANPDYMKVMFAWPWICMPIAAGVMVVIGFFVMRKIANIEV